ncbi:MAG TPA: AI-2E family transporter [Puia sp.]|jgi:predicted PurR-regulated permease PerM
MPILKKYPFYLRATVILFGLVLVSYALANLRGILIPFSFALFLAILLNPLTDRLQTWKIPKVPSILISIVIAIIAISGLWYFLATQMMHFTDQLPVLQKKTTEMVSNLQQYLVREFKVPLEKQNQYIGEAKAGIKPLVGELLGTFLGTLSTAFLLPVYCFLFLYYKTLILNFLYEVFAEENAQEVSTVLSKVKGAIQSYMYGLVIEGLIVATMNTVALLILGVPYAVLLGVLGAILNVLPFIGGALAALLPIIMATVTRDGVHTQIAIALSYIVIQFIDNHFLIPYIVSSKVRINALISILVVLLGGAVWGFSGMFLSIPFIGILKIVFDRVPELKPWGKLLGDEIPTLKRGLRPLRKKRVSQGDRVRGMRLKKGTGTSQ